MNYTANLNLAPRFETIEMTIDSKILNTQLTYQLAVENVSLSGFLARWDHDCSIPFMENSIVNIAIKSAESSLFEPIDCLGHIARKFHCQKSDKTKFGIEITRMDNHNYEKWIHCIHQIANQRALAS